MQDTREECAQTVHMRLCGEITCALARDHPSQLMRLLDKGIISANDTIDLAVVMASLAASPTSGVVGIVSLVNPMDTTADHSRHETSVCRSVHSAALPDRPVGLVELAVFYGARRCLLFLLGAAETTTTTNARIGPEQCETLLTSFLETRAWRHAVVCWGPCVLLRNRRRPKMVRPMVVAAGPHSGVKRRFFDPMPIIRAFALLTDNAAAGDRHLHDRLAMVVDAAAHLSVDLCPRDNDGQAIIPQHLGGLVS